MKKFIFEYDKHGHAAKDYGALINKVLGVQSGEGTQASVQSA